MKRNSLLLVIPLLSFSVMADDKPTTGVLSGEGTIESPHLIEDAYDLSILRQGMKDKEFFTEGKYYLLTRDISFNSGVLNADGSLSADSLSFKQWVPMSEDSWGKGFYGVFDGGGHTISGLYYNNPEGKEVGFFSFLPKEGTIKNLKIADSYFCAGESTGAVVGLCKGTISDCENSATVRAIGPTHQGGGIAGSIQNGEIRKCTNKGLIMGWSYPDKYGESWNCFTGGITGSASARIDSCLNLGQIKSQGWGPVGGISGTIGGGSYISNSINRGSVESDHDASIGGIVGSNSSSVWNSINHGLLIANAPGSCIGGIAGTNNFNSSIHGSENHADITCDVDSVFVGGIVGNLNGGRSYNTYYTPKVYTSSNTGSISTSSEKSLCGGIAGKSYCGEIHGSLNRGNVSSEWFAGGILPLGEFHSHIYESENHGTIAGRKSTGGIVGKINGEVRNSINYGAVSTYDSGNDTGGIVGWLEGSSGIVRNCVNIGDIGTGKHVGGIAGDNTSQSSIISSYNAGYVFSSIPGCYMGGVAGGSGSLRNCYNAGTVHAKGNDISIGGLTYNLWVHWDAHGNRSGSTAQNCFNMGDIIVEAENCTAGNIAASYNTGDSQQLFSNCYYLQDAIYGMEKECDLNVRNLTKADRQQFKTLAEELNKTDYPWDPKPFVQGYWRPLLVKNGSMEEAQQPMNYFKVESLKGDSVLIDLGLPSENEFFRTDSTGIVLEAYNVGDGNKFRRVKLVDGSDYNLKEGIMIDRFHYIRHLPYEYNSVCLPVNVNDTDLNESQMMLAPKTLESDSLVTEIKPVAEAGIPFILKDSIKSGYMLLRRNSLQLNPDTPEANGILNGTYINMPALPDNCYILSDEGCLKKADKEATLSAFRAYASLAEPTYDKIGIKISDGQSYVTEIENLSRPVFSVTGKTINITGLSGKNRISVMNAQGQIIYNSVSDNAEESINLPHASGLHIITAGNFSKKVILP